MRTAGAADPTSRCGETRADGGGITIHLRVYVCCAQREHLDSAPDVYSQDTNPALRMSRRAGHGMPFPSLRSLRFRINATICNFHSDSVSCAHRGWGLRARATPVLNFSL